MGRYLIYRGFLAGVCSVFCGMPVAAQEGGTQVVLGFSQRFVTDDNLDLDPVSLGRTTFAETGLSLNLNRETPLDRFSFGASAVVRAVDGPGAQSGLDDQRLDLTYGRQGANSGFSFSAGYLQSNIEFLRPLQDFETSDGEILLPPDLDDLNGTGNRERFRTGAGLELGRGGPFEARFAAEYLALKYTDTTDPGLFDNERTNLGADFGLRLSPTVTGTFGGAYRLYNADDTEDTRRETVRNYIGLNYAITPIWNLDARFGYATIDTREFGTTTRSDGPEGLVRLVREMPNGSVSAEAEQYVTEDGEIRTLSVGRSFTLPTGDFAASIGVADSELDQSAVIGSLNWRQETAQGEFSALFRRWVEFDEEKGNVLRTGLFLGYNYQINSVSGIVLDAGYTISEEINNQIDRADFVAAYQHSITKDWAVRTGYNYRMRKERAEPRANSHSVFVTLGRDFMIRP